MQVDRPLEALKTLGFDPDKPDPTRPELRARFRELRTRLHPDRPTGDAAKFSAMVKAVEAVERWLDDRPCEDCGGTGKKSFSGAGGFHPVRMVCGACGGTGKA